MVTDINILRDGKVRKMLQEEIVRTCNIVSRNLINAAEDSVHAVETTCLASIREAPDSDDALSSVSSLLTGTTLVGIGLTLSYIGRYGSEATMLLGKDMEEGRITAAEHFDILVKVTREAMGFKSNTEEGIVK